MTSSSKPPLDARLLDQATQWAARVHGDNATEEDWLALEAWLAASSDHSAAFDRAEMVLGDIDHEAGALLAALDASPTSSVVDLAAKRRARGRTATWLGPVGIAAAILLAVGLFGQVMRPSTQIFQTAPGETRLIALEDGTKINLNGASRIEVRMSGNTRRVEMARAEAVFDVAHDPSRPFIVEVGVDTVRVVGTEFNIRHDAATTVVTVRRGVVEIRPTGSAQAAVRLPAGTAFERYGERASVRKVSTERAFAWSTGRLVYDDTPLSTVAADLSRRFELPVEADAAAGRLRFTGVLVLDDEASVIARLEAFLPISAHRSQTGIRLTSKADAG